MSLLSISFFVADWIASATSPFVTVPKSTPSSPTCFLIVNLPIVFRAVLKSIASCFTFSASTFSFSLLLSICFNTAGVTFTALPCGNKSRTKVSFYHSGIVIQFNHNGIMMEEKISLTIPFDSFHNACEYGNTKSKCGKFVWKYTNTVHDDSSVIEIEKKYFSKKRTRRRLFEDVDKNLIQDSERTRKRPKRMVPDFNNASSSRYGYNIELL